MDKCESCAVDFVDHLGLTGTCKELQKVKKLLSEIVLYEGNSGKTIFPKSIHKRIQEILNSVVRR